MDGLQMRYSILIAVAGFSLILAIPLSQPPAKQLNHIAKAQPVERKVTVKAETITTVKVDPPLPTIQLPNIACAAYASLFEQYDWNVHTAVAICEAESTGQPNIVSNGEINPDGLPDYGLMQLHDIAILDPAQNISYAYYHKYLTQGWSAWSTYNNEKYLQFL